VPDSRQAFDPGSGPNNLLKINFDNIRALHIVLQVFSGTRNDTGTRGHEISHGFSFHLLFVRTERSTIRPPAFLSDTTALPSASS
jgi:hypothetical protein